MVNGSMFRPSSRSSVCREYVSSSSSLESVGDVLVETELESELFVPVLRAPRSIAIEGRTGQPGQGKLK